MRVSRQCVGVMDTFVRKIAKVKNSIVLKDFEVLLHSVTSNDAELPSEAEITKLVKASFVEGEREQLMQHLWNKLYGPREKWRKILKALTLVQHLLSRGSGEVRAELRAKMSLLNFLVNFKFLEKGKDCGEEIRQLAEEVLLTLRNTDLSPKAPPDQVPSGPARPAPYYFGRDFLVYEEEKPSSCGVVVPSEKPLEESFI